ncbi:acyl-homoserine-lactone synthase [Pontivivens ytuae]|uniref:Acyl-homoserine-lactone synthase n=1 Tax=Pontivivens ytuae TaxID=2789856 RepID=A0A7S9LTA0_9RHOB|nr:acyl-homoserine-lactone synthase [Pontivivens ytuae]QPH54793.1 acyl-homoserine-lactone synthase [Pontivivens ytuae]
MIIIANGADDPRKSHILDQMFRLRARQFSTRRGWRVVVEDGKEIDPFDALIPIYVCVVINDQLIASLRLLPTIGPYMQADVFPETMGPTALIRDPHIWESSRFVVDTEATRAFGEDGVNVATRALLVGLFQLAVALGLKNVVSVYDVFVERILRRAGCRFERLGPVVRYDDLKTVAGLFEVSRENVREIHGDDTRVQALISNWHYNSINVDQQSA